MESLLKVRKEALPYRNTGKAVLVEIDKLGGSSSVTVLSQRLSKKYFTVTGSLQNLERCGRVERIRPGVYRLTERGKAEASNLKGQVHPPEPEVTVTRPVPPPSEQESVKQDFLITAEPSEFRMSLSGEEGYARFVSLAKSFGRLAVPEKPASWESRFVELAFEIARNK